MLLSQNTFTVRRLAKDELNLVFSSDTVAIPSKNGVADLSTAEFGVKVTKGGRELFPVFDEEIGGRNYFSVIYGSTGTRKTIQLEPNTQYVLSTDIPLRPDGGRYLFVGLPDFIGNSAINGVSKGVSRVVTTETDGVLEFLFSSWDVNWLKDGVYHAKLEKGTIPTYWTPAIEDILTNAILSAHNCTAVVDGDKIKLTSLQLGKNAGYVDVTVSYGEENTVTRRFTWARAETGISVTNVDVEYAVNTSTAIAPTTGWTTTAPAISGTQQLWTRTKTTFSSGNPTYSTPVNITPQIGTGVASIIEEYYLSTSKTTQTGGSWVASPPVWVLGKYIWTRSKITYKNPTSTAYTAPIVSSEWEAINLISVGARNLLLDSGNQITNSEYNIKYYWASSLLPNKKYTVVVKADMPVGQELAVYFNSGYDEAVRFTRVAGPNVYFAQITSPSTINLNVVHLFSMPNNSTTATVYYCCLYEGHIIPPLDYVRALEDVPSAVKYLSDAFKSSVDIEGGLMAANLIMLKNQAEQITAGLSGLEGDNILLWGGGGYTEALAGLSKIILQKDGKAFLTDAYLKGVIEATAGEIGGLKILEKSLISDTITISDSPVEPLSTLTGTPFTIQLPRQSSWSKTQTGAGDVYVEVTSQVFNVFSDVTLTYKAGTTSTGSWTSHILEIRKSDGTTVRRVSYGPGNLNLQSTILATNLTAGSYYIYLYAYSYHATSGTATAWIGGATNDDIISVSGLMAKTKIGSNGFFSFWNASKYFYFSEAHGLDYRGPSNLPGVLLAGEGYSGGGGTIRFGAKFHQSNTVEKLLSSTGYYRVWHSIGHSSYTVQLTMRAAGQNAIWENPNTTYFDVRTYSGTTAVNTNFSFAVFGNN